MPEKPCKESQAGMDRSSRLWSAPVVCSGVCVNTEIPASIALPSSSPTAQVSGGWGVMVLQAGLYAMSS